mmetsp:Transcript_2615/g.8577  ORF Transcript_2615/g.8577 Transcript_2615/m.8577 type:complete len:217 (-) Transcript_2615:38-688(-)
MLNRRVVDDQRAGGGGQLARRGARVVDDERAAVGGAPVVRRQVEQKADRVAPRLRHRRLLVAVAHELCAGRVAHQVEAAAAQQRARAVASQTAAELVELHEKVAKRERRGVGELRAKRWLEQIGLDRIQVVARLRYVGEHAHHGFARLDECVACEPALLDVRKPVAHRRRGTRSERIDVRSAARRGGAGSEAEERRKDVQHTHQSASFCPKVCPPE